jgi:hypothetical protein
MSRTRSGNPRSKASDSGSPSIGPHSSPNCQQTSTDVSSRAKARSKSASRHLVGTKSPVGSVPSQKDLDTRSPKQPRPVEADDRPAEHTRSHNISGGATPKQPESTQNQLSGDASAGAAAIRTVPGPLQQNRATRKRDGPSLPASAQSSRRVSHKAEAGKLQESSHASDVRSSSQETDNGAAAMHTVPGPPQNTAEQPPPTEHQGPSLPNSAGSSRKKSRKARRGESCRSQGASHVPEVRSSLQETGNEAGSSAPDGTTLDPDVLKELIACGCTSWDALCSRVSGGTTRAAIQPPSKAVQPAKEPQHLPRKWKRRGNPVVVKRGGFSIALATGKDVLQQRRSVTASATSFLEGLERQRKRLTVG